MAKYQKLRHLESYWRWEYLMKKGADQLRSSNCALQGRPPLQSLEHRPSELDAWIEAVLPEQWKLRLDQSIRARRKRHFNKERPSTLR